MVLQRGVAPNPTRTCSVLSSNFASNAKVYIYRGELAVILCGYDSGFSEVIVFLIMWPLSSIKPPSELAIHLQSANCLGRNNISLHFPIFERLSDKLDNDAEDITNTVERKVAGWQHSLSVYAWPLLGCCFARFCLYPCVHLITLLPVVHNWIYYRNKPRQTKVFILILPLHPCPQTL